MPLRTGCKKSNLANKYDIGRTRNFSTMLCALACVFVIMWFLCPMALYSADNNSGVESAQAETAEAIAKIEKLRVQSTECYKKEKDQGNYLDATRDITEKLRETRASRAKSESLLKEQLEKAKQNPGSNDEQINKLRTTLDDLEADEKYLRHELTIRVAEANFKDIDTQQNEFEILQRECKELLDQWVDAQKNLEQLRKRAENLEDLRCENLLGEFNAAANADNPSAKAIAGILERGKDCTWYILQIEALLKFKHRKNTTGDWDNEEPKEPAQEPPPSPPVEEEVAEDDANEYFEEVGEDDSTPEPPPSPPLEENVAKDDANEYFEEVGESEAGSTTDNAYDQSDNLCSSLLAQFTATYNIEQMIAILQQAQNCGWYGAGYAALQNQIDYYNEQYQRQQQYQQQQTVHSGTVNVVPNPFPNPYALPPTGVLWTPPSTIGGHSLDRELNRDLNTSRQAKPHPGKKPVATTQKPPKTQKKPAAPPKTKPSQPQKKKDDCYPGVRGPDGRCEISGY